MYNEKSDKRIPASKIINNNGKQKLVMLKWNKIGLDVLWNFLYWYNAYNIGFSYWHIETIATLETSNKFDFDVIKTEKNEIPDRVLYKAWYRMAKELNWKDVDVLIMLKYLMPAYKKALKLEKELNSPHINLQQIQR